MKLIGFMPTAGKEESKNACRTAKDEGKSYEDTSKIDGKYGRGQDCILALPYFKVEYGKWHPKLSDTELEEQFWEFHADQNGKWDTTGPPIVKRVSFENPMYIQERVTGHESRRGVRQSAATSTERLKARSNAIEKKIFDASDEGEEDEDTDMEGDVSQLLDVPSPPHSSSDASNECPSTFSFLILMI